MRRKVWSDDILECFGGITFGHFDKRLEDRREWQCMIDKSPIEQGILERESILTQFYK